MPATNSEPPSHVAITLHRSCLVVRPCPDGLKALLTTSKPFKSRGKLYRKPLPQWGELKNDDGIVCSRGFFQKVRQFLEKTGTEFSVEEAYRIEPPPISRRVLRTVSDAHFWALAALLENLDCGGGIVLHPEGEDVSGLVRGLIRLFPGKRIVVCTPDRKKKEELIGEVNRYMKKPEQKMRPLDLLRAEVPGVAIIHEAEIRFPEPEEVDIFIMVDVYRVSGIKAQEKVMRYSRSLKFGFSSGTGNDLENKLPIMEELFGPVVCDLRTTPE